MAVKNLLVRAGADFSALKKETDKAQKTLSNFQKSTSSTMKALGATLATLSIGSIVKDAVKSAMTVEASIQQISRIMGTNSNEFLKWANTQAIAYNMSKSEALKYGAVYGNLISGFAKDTGQTLSYTEDLLKASAIVASATGRTMEDVMDRIRSGLLGNTEAIEDLGINVNVAMIESTNAFKKFANGKSWQQLNFQTQQQIRLMAILEQSSKKYGDALNQNTNSSQQQFIAQLKNAQLYLGQAFLPIYQVILPALTSFASSLANVMNIFAQFTQALFGKGQQQQQIKATQQQANAVNSVGDAYKEAGQKAKGALAGFDEINSLSDNSGGGADDTASAATASQASTSSEGSTDQISSNIQAMADKFKTNFQPIIDAFNNLQTAATPVINTVGTALKWFYDNVLVPFGTWVMNAAIPAFFNLIAGALTVLNPLLQSFQPLAGWLWTNFLQPIASWTGDAFIAALNGVGSALKAIGDWMSNNKPIVEGITTAVVAFIAAWSLVELMAFIQLSGGIVGAFNAIKAAIVSCTIAKLADKAETIALTLLYAKDFVVSLASGTAALVKNAAAWAASTVAKGLNTASTWLAVAGQIALTVATTAWNVICGIGTALTTAFGIALNILCSPITLVILAIAALVAGVILLITHWDDVKRVAGEVWDKIVEIWGKVSSWFDENVIQPVASAFTTVWNGIKSGFTTAFDFIATGIKNYINGYISVVEGFVNGFIKGINFIINAINRIKIDVPEWLQEITGMKTFGFNIGTVSEIALPRLAQGGITNGEMAAIVGDNPGGHEVISPLSTLMDMLQSAVGTAFMAAMQFNNNGKEGDIILNLDGTEIGRIINPYLERESSRRGNVAIKTT